MSWIVKVTIVVVVGAGVGLAITWWLYGGDLVWPGFISNFIASLGAFILALAWDRHSQRQADEKARREAGEELEMQLAKETESRKTEAAKRLHAVKSELDANKTSIDELASGFAQPAPAGTFRILNPQLLDSAWKANSERLGDLLSDYKLVSDLHFFYGRLEELRWRIRVRTEATTTALDNMTKPLVKELQGQVGELVAEVGKTEQRPNGAIVGRRSFPSRRRHSRNGDTRRSCRGRLFTHGDHRRGVKTPRVSLRIEERGLEAGGVN